ncbi:hypothetical protein BOTBODRAFT_55238 [Botryobasidium botryosum FD-172 SS1]|uniref:HSF-type DNA-binding domain-containing protein n=1 Tax=Botryobasidium botryosum (strain FD-172 SS1) TaxID=930990 RepID=A0A067MJ38_BOTB1|nr:hypothetical protein BOTBODRAFT_55238 [Botryobasidium botryosum FD-172 SS1]
MYPALTLPAPAADPVQQQQQQPEPQPQQPSPVDDARDDSDGAARSQDSNGAAKLESKPQATFLTKLYALLERPEYQSMIRWDPLGEQIIVERPEQLALHVLPSIYRQSRFASFSRQLNIYGFMRKVNLRNVDPAIDDPDASTWSHPTLNRNSPPEVVANFKRRVPPRLPKPRKRSDGETMSNGISIPTVPSSIGAHHHGKPMLGSLNIPSRARGFSAPNLSAGLPYSTAPNYLPSAHSKWSSGGYPRTALPPLMVPSEPGYISAPSSAGGYHSHHSHPITPTDEHSHHGSYYSSIPTLRDSNVFTYPYQESSSTPTSAGTGNHSWGSYNLPPASSLTSPSSGANSLSSLLNPPSLSSSYSSRPSLTSAHSFPSPYSSYPGSSQASSLSPESRPNTGYSVASSSMPYDLDPSPTNTSHGYDYRPPSSGRPLTPMSSSSSTLNGHIRPGSSKTPQSSSLSVRRQRRRSEAITSPYPSPYYDASAESSRPGTAPEDAHVPSVRSLMQLGSSDNHGHSQQQHHGGNHNGSTNGNGNYVYTPAPADFAYSAGAPAGGSSASVDSMDSWNGASGGRGLRPSTSTSSLSAGSHGSSHSAIHTPPGIEDAVVPSVHDSEITRNEYF